MAARNARVGSSSTALATPRSPKVALKSSSSSSSSVVAVRGYVSIPDPGPNWLATINNSSSLSSFRRCGSNTLSVARPLAANAAFRKARRRRLLLGRALLCWGTLLGRHHDAFTRVTIHDIYAQSPILWNTSDTVVKFCLFPTGAVGSVSGSAKKPTH